MKYTISLVILLAIMCCIYYGQGKGYVVSNTKQKAQFIVNNESLLDKYLSDSKSKKNENTIHAQDTAIIDTVMLLKKLNIKNSECYNGFSTGILRAEPLPFVPESLVVVIPKVVENDDEVYTLDGYVLIVNNKSDIISKFYRHNMWTSDAIGLKNIIIDPSLYWINKKKYAFGIRVRFENHSRANPYEETDFYLFVQRGDSLVNILDSYMDYYYKGESDTNCAGSFEMNESTFTMDATHQTNGYNNIIVKTTITEKKFFLVKGDCKEKSRIKKTTTDVLKFINGKYQNINK